MTVFVDVFIIVKVYKIKILYLPIYYKDSHNEKQANQHIPMFDDKLFASIINSGHGKIADNEDGILWMDSIIKLNFFLIKVITNWLSPKTVSTYRKYAFIQDFYHCQSDEVFGGLEKCL